jgi:hypothetical protein
MGFISALVYGRWHLYIILRSSLQILGVLSAGGVGTLRPMPSAFCGRAW